VVGDGWCFPSGDGSNWCLKLEADMMVNFAFEAINRLLVAWHQLEPPKPPQAGGERNP